MGLGVSSGRYSSQYITQLLRHELDLPWIKGSSQKWYAIEWIDTLKFDRWMVGRSVGLIYWLTTTPFFVFPFSRIKKSRDDYIKRLNGIYETNLEKVSLLREPDDVQQDQVFKCCEMLWHTLLSDKLRNAHTHTWQYYTPVNVMRLSLTTHMHAPTC